MRLQPSALIRTVHVGVHPLAVAVDERTGHVFVVSQDDHGQGSVDMLAAASGKALRTLRLGTLNVLGPEPNLYLSYSEPAQVVAVDQASGRVFVVNAGQPDTAPNSSPVQGPGSVYVLDAASGALLRTVRVGFGAMAVAADERSGRVFVANVFEDQGHGTVDILDAHSGTVRRVVPLRLGAAAFAVDAAGSHVFVGGPLGVSMLDAATGTVRATLPTARQVEGLAVDSRVGRVAVSFSLDDRYVSRVLLLDARTGGRLQGITVQVDDVYPIAVDAAHGHVLLNETIDYMDLGAALVVLDLRSGRILHTTQSSEGVLPVGVFGPLLVDTGLNRVFTAGTALGSFDTRTGAFLHLTAIPRRGIPSPAGPSAAIALDAQMQHLFVSNWNAGTVTTFDATRI